MSIDNLDERLAAMQPAFQQASSEPSSTSQFDPPPDGDYQALVKGFDFFEAKTSGQAFLKTELEVVHDAAHNGRQVETVHNLEDPERLDWLKKHLAVLGVDVTTLDLRQIRPGSELLSSLLDTPVEISVKTSNKKDAEGKPYRNIYVNRKLGGPIQSDIPAPAVQPVGAVAGGLPDDKIPFGCSRA